MKRSLIVMTVFLAVLFFSMQVFSAGTMNVQLRDVQVKATPNYLGATVGRVVYGDAVNVVSEEGNWRKIAKPSGYIPKSAVTKNKVAKNPDQMFAAGSVKHDEVALAGKGFNPQVEAEYKKNNADVAAAFVQVDKVEKLGASEAELNGFKSSGKLVSK